MDKLDVAFKSASYNMVLQVMIRICSFIMNGVVLRYVQAELLGVVNLRCCISIR